MRKYRIFRLWFYGKLKLAKKVRHRIVIEKLLKHAKTCNPVWGYFTPQEFENTMNLAAMNYFLKSKPTTP